MESVELKRCYLGNSAFYGCVKLKNVTWTDAYTSSEEIFRYTPFERSMEMLIIGEVLQKYNGMKKTVVIPENVKRIGANAFYENKTLKEVLLPKAVSYIGQFAFGRCDKLTSVNLENVLQIHNGAFRDCEFFCNYTAFNERVAFYGDPFGGSLLGKTNTTPDGIVINKILVKAGYNFIDDVWHISEGICRITCEEAYHLYPCYGKTVVIPESVKEINNLICFKYAKKIIIKSNNIIIGNSPDLSQCIEDFIICFDTKEGLSEFMFYRPKWKKDNPVYAAVEQLYTSFFERIDRWGISEYDDNILKIGLTYRQMLDIAYKRLIGGYMLKEKNREKYMDFVRTHYKKGLKYATEENNEAKIEFFVKLCKR